MLEASVVSQMAGRVHSRAKFDGRRQ